MELTIDELAARSGISVRTIRFYAGRDLIPPPRLRGRTGLYDDDHLARLELIRDLSALGFTLAATERYVARLPSRLGAAELALQRALLTPWVRERAEEIDRTELRRRAGRPLTDAEVDALAGLGIIEEVADGRVRLRGGLDASLAMLDAGLPAEVWHRSRAVIDHHTAALARDLMQVFQDGVLQPYRDRGRPAGERRRLATACGQLKPIAVQGLVAAFERAVDQAIRDRVE